MKLARVFLGSLWRRRLASLLSLLAIVLGVALGMAVEALHHSALGEFDRGLRSLTGATDLQIVGPRSGFDEGLYALLAARPEVAEASPVIELSARLVGRAATLPVLGVDVFNLARVNPALLPRPANPAERFAALADDRLFLSAAARAELGLEAGQRLALQAGSGSAEFSLAGDIPGADARQRLAVLDIAGAQRAFGMLGKLSRIDLRLVAGLSPDQARLRLQPLLPAGVVAVAPQAAVDQTANLSRAYRVNLSLLAAIALFTGAFLVFSAQSLSVLRRRTEFAFLRALGLSQRQLFAWLLGEGALVGLAGGILGVSLGHGLAWAALELLGGDLGAGYFSGLQPDLLIQPGAAVMYLGLGLIAGLAGAWLPAREAARLLPAQALKAGDEVVLVGAGGHPRFGAGLLLLSLLACAIPPYAGLPIGGYLAVAGILAGGLLLLPSLAGRAAGCLPERGPVPLRLAAARLNGAPGFTVVAAAGVFASVALAVAMAIMVASFRDSVDAWLAQILPADLYLRAGRSQAGAYLDTALQQRIVGLDGVGRVRFTRHESLRLPGSAQPVALIARPVSPDAAELPLVGRTEAPRPGAIWISEAMQDEHGWRVGQSVELPLAGRAVRRHVAGVWRDYARQTGAILIDLEDYRRLTGDPLANDAAIFLAPGAPAGQVAEALLGLAPPGVLELARPGEIRAQSLAIFDRTFAVTYLLEAVAIVIGLAGVAASFAALAAARRHEFGMLRHLGVSRRQIGAMLALEGALAASVGVLGGLLAGGAIGLVLIEVINRQSFHWSMDLHLPWASLGLFAAAMIGLAALAARLAGRQALQRGALLAVREDW